MADRGGEPHSLEDVRSVGKHLGLAFQIADDIGDMDRDAGRQKKGKPGFNIAHEIGKDEAMREMERNLRAARLNLERLRLWSDLWASIEKKVIGMAALEAGAVSGINAAEQKSSPRNPASTGMGVAGGADRDTGQAARIGRAAGVAPMDISGGGA